MKLCDIYVGRLVRVTTAGNVIGAVDSVVRLPNKKGETMLIRIQYAVDVMGNKLYVEAYPSELEPLTEEDM